MSVNVKVLVRGPALPSTMSYSGRQHIQNRHKWKISGQWQQATGLPCKAKPHAGWDPPAVHVWRVNSLCLFLTPQPSVHPSEVPANRKGPTAYPSISETSLVSKWPVARSSGLSFPPKSSSSLAIFTRISLTSSPMYIPLIIFSNLQGEIQTKYKQNKSLLPANLTRPCGSSMYTWHLCRTKCKLVWHWLGVKCVEKWLLLLLSRFSRVQLCATP